MYQKCRPVLHATKLLKKFILAQNSGMIIFNLESDPELTERVFEGI